MSDCWRSLDITGSTGRRNGVQLYTTSPCPERISPMEERIEVCYPAREVCLLENEHVFYTKSEIEAFQTHSWLDYISNRCQVRSRNSEMDNEIMEMISTAQEGDRDIRDYPLNGKNSLFRFETCKGLDSFLIDSFLMDSL